MKRHAAPIIAAILLLLPVLYVGSYLALVDPEGNPMYGSFTDFSVKKYLGHYRYGGRWSANVFWPLEQIDRKVRPGAWEPLLINDRPSFHDRRSDPPP
jgi:hypothetical protein